MAFDNMSEQKINIRFVKEVQKYPSLYNFELPTYTRRDVSNEAWENVGKTMNMTPSACRERWRNLRAVFMRTMKKAAMGKNKPYYLSEVMQFVIPFMRPVAKAKAEAAKAKQRLQVKPREESKKPVQFETSSVEQFQVDQIKVETLDDVSDESSEQSSIEEEKEITATRKRPVQEEIPHQSIKIAKISQPSSSSMTLDSDHVRSFLNSLIPELNEMNSAQFKNFKRRVLLLIDDIVTETPGSPRRPIDEEFIM